MIYWFIGFMGYEMTGAYVAYWAVRNQYIRRLTFLEWIVVISSWPFILPKLRKDIKARSRLKPFEEYISQLEETEDEA